MFGAPRFLGPGTCLALVMLGCMGGSNPPPVRGLDSGAAPNAAAGPAKAASGTTAGAENIVNVYNWSDFIDPSVIPAFEHEYGIKVNYDVFDSNEELETKLLVGQSNYDVVMPAGGFLERGVGAGVYQKLDKAQLPNLKNLDPEAMRDIAVYDPANLYAVDYTWLTSTGIGYDVAKIRARMTDAPVDSWRMIFDPSVISRFQDCGVSVLDAPDDIVSSVFAFLGKDPNSESPDDLKSAEQVLLAIRPYIRFVDSTRYYDALANGELCLVLGWAGDITQARYRAKEAGKDADIAYSIPKEGSVMSFDLLAIPAGAPHPRNAHLFINYLLRPDVAARNSNAIKYATPVVASLALLNPELRSDPGVYPGPEIRAKLKPERAKSLVFTRLTMRTWTRFKTGK
jgi:putrescine transport system substrate-binding protein